MPDQDLTERGRSALLGAGALTLGGLLALFGLMYGPFDHTDELGNTIIGPGAVPIAAVGAVAAILLGAVGGWLFRPSIPMIFCAVLVVLAGLANLVEVLPAL